MATERKEEVRVIRDGNYARRQRVVEYTPSTRDVIVTRLTQFLILAVAIVIGLIGFRFILMLIGANPANEFVNGLYNFTDTLVSPFLGIVSTPDVTTGGVVDSASLFAIVVYFFATWMLIALLNIVFGTSKSHRRTTTIEREG